MTTNAIFTRTKTLIALALVAVLTGCTAEEQIFMTALVNRPIAVPQAELVRIPATLTDDQLARLARCESGGNPRAMSRSRKYFGLYQFDQRTWNGIAQTVAPEYVGVNPADAAPEFQTMMARGLHAQRGRSPWPVCGRRM